MIKPYTHLIAAVDFTPCCLNALRQAVRLAAPSQARLTVVHVMDEFLVHELKRALSTDQAMIRADWQAKLRKFVEDAELGVPNVNVEVRIGHAFTELMDACQSDGADLLVMGVKGSRMEPHRVGVIASQCVRKAPVDVLLVREDAWGAFKHVTTCVDFSDNSTKAAQRAVQIAEMECAKVDCLYVYQSALAMSLDYGGIMPPLSIGADDETLTHWKNELAAFAKMISTAAPNVQIATNVLERINIREAILNHVCETHADLVVLGKRGKSGLREMLIGTTAERIVAHAPCSILAVKPSSASYAEE
jgi:universal stress protein E